jgi:hypothetical protein
MADQKQDQTLEQKRAGFKGDQRGYQYRMVENNRWEVGTVAEEDGRWHPVPNLATFETEQEAADKAQALSAHLTQTEE